MSTCHALIELIDGITQSLDAKQYAKRHSTQSTTNIISWYPWCGIQID